MRNTVQQLSAVLIALPIALPGVPQAPHASTITLDPSTKLEVTNGRVLWVDYRGRRALKLAPREGHERDTDQIGISFRVRGDSAERFYLRPENSRGNSQLYRNRSTQYESEPDFPWQRLRQEAPGVYESYVDVISGAWTKLGRCRGRIALWTRVSSEAYFANLRVTPR